MEPITVLILAGGRSSRMGRDKVWLDLNGMPLVELIARRLLPLAGEIIFSSNDPSRFGALVAQLPVPAIVTADLYQNAGPLAGLHAGLRAARYDSIFAVAADMPFADHSLVTAMIEHCPNVDAIVPGFASQTWMSRNPSRSTRCIERAACQRSRLPCRGVGAAWSASWTMSAYATLRIPCFASSTRLCARCAILIRPRSGRLHLRTSRENCRMEAAEDDSPAAACRSGATERATAIQLAD